MSCFNRGGDCKPCYERNLARIKVARTPATPAPNGAVWKSKCVYSCRPEFPCSGCDQDALDFARGQLLSQIACPGAPTKPTEPVCSKCTPGCADCDVPQPEPTKWEPKVGEEVIYDGDGLAEVIAVDGAEAWLKSRFNGSRFNYCVASLKPLPARKVRKQTEWQHKNGELSWHSEVEWLPLDAHKEWTPTGRTHSFEVDDE